MDYKNLMYNMNGNTLVQNKIKRNKEFINIICIPENPKEKGFTDSEIDKLGKVINTCNDSGDYVSLIRAVPVRDDNLFDRYLYSFYTLIYLFTQSGKEITETHYSSIKNHFKLFEGIINNNRKLIDDDFVDKIMNKVGEYINTIGRAISGVTIDYVYYLSPKTIRSIESIHESVGDSDSGENRIISPSDPDGCKTSVDINLNDNPIDYLMELIHENDHDYFVHKINRLYNFLLRLNGDFSNDYTKAFIEVANYILSKVIDDITGKEILLDTLSKCDQLLSDIVPVTVEISENIDIMISKIEEITNIIEEHPDGDVSLLDEMGLGYIYNVFPKEGDIINLSEAVEYLNSYAENNNMLSVISESIEILNEGIKESIQQHKERRQKDKEFEEKKKDEKYQLHDDTYDTRVDIHRRRQNDEYDLERDKTRDKYEFNKNMNQQKREDKYSDKRALRNQDKLDKQDLKEQKRQDKYDFKQQKKLDKYEQKKRDAEDKKRQIEDDKQYKRELDERKHQERLEARQRRRDETKIGINRWKTLELTNANARKAANAVRKAVKAGAAAGVGALAGINPIFAGAAYLMTSYAKDKRNPRADRKKVIDEMKQQLAEIDEKIDQCSRKGEDDKKVALIKMKRKLETAYGRHGLYDVTESEMVEERRRINY